VGDPENPGPLRVFIPSDETSVGGDVVGGKLLQESAARGRDRLSADTNVRAPRRGRPVRLIIHRRETLWLWSVTVTEAETSQPPKRCRRCRSRRSGSADILVRTLRARAKLGAVGRARAFYVS